MNINLTDILSQIPENGKITQDSIDSITAALRKELYSIKDKQEKEEAAAEEKRQREKEEAAKQAIKEKKLDAARRNLLKATIEYLALIGQISENKIKEFSKEEELSDLMFIFDIIEGKFNNSAKQNARKNDEREEENFINFVMNGISKGLDPLKMPFELLSKQRSEEFNKELDKIIRKTLETEIL